MNNPEEEQPEAADDTIEIGQAALAIISMTAVLRGEMPRVGVGLQKQIVGIDRRIDELARAFVADELPKKLSVPRPFVYRKLLERFTKPISEAETATIMSKFPPDATDAALSFQSTLQSAYAHVSEMLPVATFDTYLGPKNIKPTSDKLFDFYLQYWVIDDPMVAFQLMQMGAIIPEQVTAIKEFYPSLYNYMKVATLNAIATRSMREPSFVNLPPRADRGLATFKQQRIVPFGPNSHVTPPNEPRAADSEPPKLNKGLQTQAQRDDAI